MSVQTLADEIISEIEENNPQVPTESKHFEIETVTSAAWAVRRIQHTYKNAEKIISEVDGEIEKLKAFKKAVLDKAEKSTEYLRGKLEQYTRRELEGKRERSIQLPGAVIGLRKNPAKIEIADESKVLAELKRAYPEFVRVKESIDKKGLKAYIQQTGEIIPGVEIVEGEESFSIKEVE